MVVFLKIFIAKWYCGLDVSPNMGFTAVGMPGESHSFAVLRSLVFVFIFILWGMTGPIRGAHWRQTHFVWQFASLQFSACYKMPLSKSSDHADTSGNEMF